MNTIYAIIACSLGLLIADSPCYAEMYQWVDKNGTVYFTDNPSKIPSNNNSTSVQPEPTASEKPNYDNRLKQSFPILAIREMLGNKEFEKLNAILLKRQIAYEKDPGSEDNLLDAYLSFSDSMYQAEASLNEWVEKYPEAYQPYLARASYFHNLGWKSRGTKWANETADDQLERMKSCFSKSRQDVARVLKIRQDLVVPYYLLINIYKTSGSKEEVKAIVNKALEHCPDSFRIRASYLQSITPRWGGSYEEMDRFAAEAQQYSVLNPRMKALQGYVYYDAGNMQSISKNYGVALELMHKAISFGATSLIHEERAKIFERLGKYDEALKDVNTAIDLSRQNADLYHAKSRILCGKKMMKEALKDIEIADLLKPNDEHIAKRRKWIADTFAYSGHSKQKANNLAGAIEDYNFAIQAVPNDASLYYRRARAFQDKNDPAPAVNDLKKAIELDPNDFDSYLLMDRLLTPKSDWDVIINFWSRYLSLHPDNDRAYMERGGAYYHKGDLVSAVADAKKAADLGNAEGQRMYTRYKGRVTK